MAIQNIVLRLTLVKWHPLLLDYKRTKKDAVSPFEHERLWDKSGELRRELNNVRKLLTEHADILAEVADVPSLIIERAD